MPDTTELILEMVKSVDGRLSDLTTKVDDLPSRHEFEDLKRVVSNHGKLPNWIVSTIAVVSLVVAMITAFSHITATAAAATNPPAIIERAK